MNAKTKQNSNQRQQQYIATENSNSIGNSNSNSDCNGSVQRLACNNNQINNLKLIENKYTNKLSSKNTFINNSSNRINNENI